MVPGVCAMAPPDFGRSVNPISTRGTDYARLITTGTPEFSDLPTALDMTKNECRAVGTGGGGAMIDIPISELIESLNQNVVSMALDVSMVENGRIENVAIQSWASTSEAVTQPLPHIYPALPPLEHHLPSLPCILPLPQPYRLNPTSSAPILHIYPASTGNSIAPQPHFCKSKNNHSIRIKNSPSIL